MNDKKRISGLWGREGGAWGGEAIYTYLGAAGAQVIGKQESVLVRNAQTMGTKWISARDGWGTL